MSINVNLIADILALISDSTGLEKFSSTDNFFHQGLDSLRAMQLRNSIEQRLGYAISLSQLYENPTAETLSTVLASLPQSKVAMASTNQEYAPLTPLQLAFYATETAVSEPVNNINLAFLVDGEINTAVLLQTLRLLVQRHASLRTVFRWRNSKLQQQVLEQLEPYFNSSIKKNFTSQALSDQEAPWHKQAFSLEQGPLFRVWHIRSDAGDFLVFNTHHIVFDGWSCRILIRDFNIFYNQLLLGQSPFLSLPKRCFFDYAFSLSEAVDQEYRQECDRYWRTKLAGYNSNFYFPQECSSTNNRKNTSEQFIFSAANYSFNLSADQRIRLYRFAKNSSSTAFVSLLSIFKLWLYQISGEPDICVGTAVANRGGTAEDEQIIGPFINLLPLRNSLTEVNNLTELVAAVQQTVTEAFVRQDYLFENILADSGQKEWRSLHGSLLKVMLIYHTYQQPALQVGSFKSDFLPLYRNFTEHYFTFYVEDGADGEVQITVEYATDLFSLSTVKQWAQQFLELFELCLSSEINLSEFGIAASKPVGSQVPAVTLSTVASDTDSNAVVDMAELLDVVCQNYANNPAVYDSVHDLEWSYEELWRRSSFIVSRLQALGLQKGDLLAFQLRPSAEGLCLILSLLRLGVAWLPLDFKNPPERVRQLLAQSGANFYLTSEPFLPDTDKSWQTLEFEALFGLDFMLCEVEAVAGVPSFSGTEVAYVIYTSGSTGEPKGVEISRQALSAFAGQAAKLYNFTELDHVLQFASWSFDACIEEIFPTLLTGGKLIIFPNTRLQDIPTFFRFIHDLEISILDLPTAFWQAIVSTMLTDHLLLPDTVRTVIIGGEAASTVMWQQWHALVSARVRLFNSYGPTEATVVATTFQGVAVPAEYSTVPIGVALDHVHTYVLNESRKVLDDGQEGELWLGGSALANGYRHDEKRTAEVFVYFPEFGERLYKTGDLVVRALDGNLVYKGRIDRQVKLRGFRIDCIEVENVILQCTGVRQVAVGLHNEQLMAAIVADTVNLDDIRAHLQNALPAYMHPVLHLVAEIPLNSSGKVDLQVLQTSFMVTADTQEQPLSSLPMTNGVSLAEQLVLKIWQDVLHNSNLQVEDNFFASGGSSLLALQLIHRLTLAGFKIRMDDIFLYPSVRELSAVLTMNVVSSITDKYPSCVVQLCPGMAEKDKKPLFLPHSVPGDVLGYTDLVLALGAERPCYGIQSTGLSNLEFLQSDVKKMAQIYADQIISFYDGPLLIAGWCYGGILALEIANEFLRRGRAVKFVGIMELDLLNTEAKDIQRCFWRWWRLFSSGPLVWASYLRTRFVRKFFRSSKQSNYALEYDSGFLKNRSVISKANMEGLKSYLMTEFPSEIKLFLAADELRIPDCEWRLFTQVETFLFAANHRSILQAPTVQELANAINHILQRLGN